MGSQGFGVLCGCMVYCMRFGFKVSCPSSIPLTTLRDDRILFDALELILAKVLNLIHLDQMREIFMNQSEFKYCDDLE